MKKFYKTESGLMFDEIDVDVDSPHNDGQRAKICSNNMTRTTDE